MTTATAVAAAPAGRRAPKRVLPGFGLSLGYTLFYLSIIVLIPLSALIFKTFTLTWEQFWVAISCPAGGGLVPADLWRFVPGGAGQPGVRFADGLGAGALQVSGQEDRRCAGGSAVCAAHRGGRHFADRACWRATAGLASTWSPWASSSAFTPLGMVMALIFIGLPFVVRTVQPVLEDAEKELEEAATSLGATPLADLHQGDPALASRRRCSPALPWPLRGRWASTAR